MNNLSYLIGVLVASGPLNSQGLPLPVDRLEKGSVACFRPVDSNIAILEHACEMGSETIFTVGPTNSSGAQILLGPNVDYGENEGGSTMIAQGPLEQGQEVWTNINFREPLEEAASCGAISIAGEYEIDACEGFGPLAALLVRVGEEIVMTQGAVQADFHLLGDGVSNGAIGLEKSGIYSVTLGPEDDGPVLFTLFVSVLDDRVDIGLMRPANFVEFPADNKGNRNLLVSPYGFLRLEFEEHPVVLEFDIQEFSKNNFGLTWYVFPKQ